MDYRVQRLKEDLTNAQQRNKKQRIQLANYKKCHERDLGTIKKQKEVIDKIESLIKSKDNGTCIHNNERRGAYTFVLDFDEAREFVWNLEDILKEVSK